MPQRYSLLLLLTAALSPTTHALTQFDPSDPKSCKIIGDPDIYGTGIRISFYLQWASLLLAIWLAPETTKNIRISTNIVSFALFINVFRSVHSNSLVFLEFYLVSWMTIYLLLANIPLSKALLRKSFADTTAMLGLWFMFTCAQVYLYSKGLHVGARQDCVVWIWYADTKPNHHVLDIYYHATSQLVGACLFVVGLLILVPYLIVVMWVFDRDTTLIMDDDVKWSTVMKVVSSIANVILGSISIATVEKTIRQNKIDLSAAPLLQSSGQLIALIMGILSLITVIWAYFNPFDKEEEESSEPAPPSQQSSARRRRNDSVDPEQGNIPLQALDPAPSSQGVDRPEPTHAKSA